MHYQETLDMLTLASALHFTPDVATALYRKTGSAAAAMAAGAGAGDIMPGCNGRTAEALRHTGAARRRAEAELEYAMRNGIKIMCLGDGTYPLRLKECTDAPPVMFFKGTADLNCRHIVSIVGTRRCTSYGQDCVRRFVGRLQELCPDTLIVSGLAYGIDICAHREALAAGTATVGVLAHGLDYLYPPRHKDTADEMLARGGLLTEHFTRTNADKLNFLRRNRIVAGMADAVIVAESASHGGALVTARIAGSYGRDVFAFPGRVGDEMSEGCNNLIRDNKAALITSADDFVKAMGWETDARIGLMRRQGIERSLFPELSPGEQAVAELLKKENDLQINTIAARTGTPVGTLTATMFSLEMKGVVKARAGGIYHLID